MKLQSPSPDGLTQEAASDWIRSWDRQQELYGADRELRFARMCRIISDLAGDECSVLDLACGPGCLGSRILAAVSHARVIGLDYDPVLLKLARTATAGDNQRGWIEADLRDPLWSEAVTDKFDFVVSTTALHWLTEEGLEKVYGDIRHILKPGGVFLNGDHLYFSPVSTVSAKLAEMEAARALKLGASGGGQTWEDWWGAASRSPDLSAEYALRAERFPGFEEEAITAEFHVGALKRVGFKEAEIVWRNLNNCLVLGIA